MMSEPVVSIELVRWAKKAHNTDLEEVIRFLGTVVSTLSSEESWTHGYSAVNARDEEVDPESSDACRWCLTGAITKSWRNDQNDFLLRHRQQTVELLDMQVVERWPESPPTCSVYTSLANFNDSFDYSDVYGLLEDTLGALEKESQTRGKLNV